MASSTRNHTLDLRSEVELASIFVVAAARGREL